MPKHILIVDDTLTVRMFEKMILAREGYQLEEATNGVEALERIAKKVPDIVLLDVVMPQMDGIECCRRIKSDPATKDVPVIIVTTKGEEDKVKEGYAAGCNDYLTKPIKKVELMVKIRNLIGR